MFWDKHNRCFTSTRIFPWFVLSFWFSCSSSCFILFKRKRHLAKTFNYLMNKRTHLESTNVPWLPYLCMYSVGSAHLPSNNIPINVPPVAQLRYPTEDNTRVFTQSNPSIVSLPMILPGHVFHRISLLCKGIRNCRIWPCKENTFATRVPPKGGRMYVCVQL